MAKSSEGDLKTEKVQLLATKEWVEKVDEYGFSNRIRSRGEVIRLLVEKGLEAEERISKEKGEASA